MQWKGERDQALRHVYEVGGREGGGRKGDQVLRHGPEAFSCFRLSPTNMYVCSPLSPTNM